MSLSTQLLTMLSMITGGLATGVMLDTFRRFSHYWKNRRIMVYVMEIGFWFTQTLLLFYILFLVNGGEIRLYIVLACLLGFSFYQAILSNRYKKLLEHGIRLALVIYRFFSRLVQIFIISPIKGILYVIYAVLVWLLKLFASVLFFILAIILKPVQWLLRGLYQILPKKVQRFLLKIAGFYSTIKNKLRKVWNRVSWKRR
ncbi:MULTISPECIES: spore cortex biosynthesis protein YabQ [Clostridia]|uniref:spore cortex biosynthesis protein YabQ n=1 Tax=Clostridia TaxID=186801 RepID=UPI000EA1E7E5|nr:MULTISPECIES: spore cortex biosynthesis protein YabQ [Clostridia]NBJ71257.1 spore cortex biosynthesis protein YabQ [Roseburia sp. 1XD42-34]RKI74885.1 spore cortex biosynthesis protein YabQ [Clostridium sp. 1xD42-85]